MGCRMVDNIVVFLMQLKGIGRKTIYRYFHLESGTYSLGDIREILREAASVTGKVRAPEMRELEKAYEEYKRTIEGSRAQGIRIITYLEPDFPVKLRGIDDPPAVIYTKGDIGCLNEKAVAVIGTREPIEYGARVAENLGYVLGRDGYTVVSGLAHGCDRSGHMGCLRAKGRTAAVMAGGLDRIYPSQHEELAREIVWAGGCLVSEYAVGGEGLPGEFRGARPLTERAQRGYHRGGDCGKGRHLAHGGVRKGVRQADRLLCASGKIHFQGAGDGEPEAA